MKKFIYILAAVLMLAACDNKNAQSSADVTSQQEEPQSKVVTASETDDNDGWRKQSTILSSKPMVVDFFATWCGPCKQLAPILEEIEQNHKGEVIFERIDVDEKTDLAQEFGIEAIPMLMFITPSGEYQTLVGLQSPEVIEEKIAQLLKRSAK